MGKNEILDTLREVIERPRNAYLDRWRGNGGKVMGYYCSYIPEEVFTAAGFLPYRLRGAGSKDSSDGDAYMSSRICTFVRHTVSLALRNELDFLDGVVLMQNCDHIRRAADIFAKKVKVPFNSFLSVPRAPQERLFQWYLDEVRRLKSEIESFFGLTVTNADLEKAIELHNATRERIARLYELRKRDRPPITGEAALGVTIAAHLMPKGEFNNLIDDLLIDLDGKSGNDTYRARIIVTGSEMDDPEYIASIEKQGALSVAEIACFGQRSFGDLIPAGDGDSLERIARHKFFQIPCARMVECFDEQVEMLKNTVRDFNAHAIIFQRIKFCDPWAGDGHSLYWRMKQEGIPFLSLEREYKVPAAGQVGTRVQAFLEQMGK
ncbi:MAG: 2-hydroxyacyl-CoA dehydratase [Dehalococcoidia bacterium]|nr:MAG: 2-hydroxyacyl-CoA dehydratase [Dehalococcoidia bacterium]